MKTPNFTIVSKDAAQITLQDIGPWDVYPTITQNPEAVIEWLFYMGELPSGREVYYWDTEGRRDQITHDGRSFTGFRCLPNNKEKE